MIFFKIRTLINSSTSYRPDLITPIELGLGERLCTAVKKSELYAYIGSYVSKTLIDGTLLKFEVELNIDGELLAISSNQFVLSLFSKFGG